MRNWLIGLLNTCAVTSSAILEDGKENFAYSVANMSTFFPYLACGIGNDTATVAAANNSGIYGTNNTYADVNASYESDTTAVWEHTWNYSDITGHKMGESVIAKNRTEYADNCLARIVFDDITLNSSDTMKITLKIAF